MDFWASNRSYVVKAGDVVGVEVDKAVSVKVSVVE